MKRSLVISFLIVLSAARAMGHGKSLSVNPSQVEPTGKISIKGAGLGHNQTVKLALQGALTSYPLGEAPGNAHGEFQLEAVVPQDVKPGSYTVTAQVGDSSASASLKVLAPASAATTAPMPHEPEPGATQAEKEPSPSETPMSVEPLPLRHTRTLGERATIWGLIILATVAGVVLWSKASPASEL